jgi:serine/threonine-protein kinase
MNEPREPEGDDALIVGDVVDARYRIEDVHAKGGMGTVFRAKHMQLDRLVALKVASPEIVRLPLGVGRFLREAHMATQLQSDHIAQVFDVGTLPGGTPYLVMEWLEGRDLSQVLKQSGAMSVETAVDCVLQVCEALAEVHGAGIVHRDLKPSNLFLVRAPDGKPRVKLLDFGVSKLGVSAETCRITQVGTVLGSPSYMSPEQMGEAESSDERTDVWGLGVVLFELMTTELPFGAGTLDELLSRIILEPRRKASEIRNGIPTALDAVIGRCLDADPAARFPDVACVAAALAPFGPPGSSERALVVAGITQNARESGPRRVSAAPVRLDPLQKPFSADSFGTDPRLADTLEAPTHDAPTGPRQRMAADEVETRSAK